jgi:erythromycin esterase
MMHYLEKKDSRRADDYYILFSKNSGHMFQSVIDHRAIGVVYNPAREKYGNYVPSILARRYDAFFFLDATKALHPLHLHPDKHKLPATYPFSL